MGGFSRASLIKGASGQILNVNNDGSVEVDLQALHRSVKSTGINMAANAVTPLPATILANRKTILIYNDISGDLYLGGADVDNLNGFPLTEGAYITIDLGNVGLYGYSQVSGEIRILEVA